MISAGVSAGCVSLGSQECNEVSFCERAVSHIPKAHNDRGLGGERSYLRTDHFGQKAGVLLLSLFSRERTVGQLMTNLREYVGLTMLHNISPYIRVPPHTLMTVGWAVVAAGGSDVVRRMSLLAPPGEVESCRCP